jgi:hypothetical protein
MNRTKLSCLFSALVLFILFVVFVAATKHKPSQTSPNKNQAITNSDVEFPFASPTATPTHKHKASSKKHKKAVKKAKVVSASASIEPQKAAIVFLEGRATVLHGTTKKIAKVGTSILENDTVELLHAATRVVILTAGGAEIRLHGKTELQFSSLTQQNDGTLVTRMKLLAGRIWAHVKKLKTPDSKFEIESGGFVCGVRGTTLGGEYHAGENRGAFYNYEGKVYVSDGTHEVLLDKGLGALFENGRFGSTVAIPPDVRNSFEFKGFNASKAEETLQKSGPSAGGTTTSSGTNNASSSNGGNQEAWTGSGTSNGNLSDALVNTLGNTGSDASNSDSLQKSFIELDLFFHSPETNSPVGNGTGTGS